MISQNMGITIIPNRGLYALMALEIGFILTYPLAMWFGFAVLKSLPALIAFTIVWVILIIVIHFAPEKILKIGFDKTGLMAVYRKGTKNVRYEEIIRAIWRKDFAGGTIILWNKEGEIIRLAFLSKLLTDKTLSKIVDARPDLLMRDSWQVTISASIGILEDEEHLGMKWAWKWKDVKSHKRTFYGARPKKKDDA